MTKQDDPLSTGPLTLKFTGVDEETTSDDEEEEEEEEKEEIEEKNVIPIHTPDSALCTRNGNTHNLTINNCYENNYGSHRRNQSTSIPYKIYFEHRERCWTFIPNTDVIVVNVAVSREHHFRLNPFFCQRQPNTNQQNWLERLNTRYTITLRHGEFNWTITKKYKDLVIFFERMNVFQKTAALPFPTTSHREIRRQMSHSHAIQGLTLKPDVLVDDNDINDREKLVADKLYSIVNHPVLSLHNECIKFVESSPLSFIRELGRKYKEGIVKKNSGGYRQGCCGSISARIKWLKRWLITKDSWIAYLNPKTGHVRAVMLVDKFFHVRTGRVHTGSVKKLYISNLARRLYLNCPTERKAIEYFDDINRMLKTTGRDFHIEKRFNSFAPIRVNTKCQWLVDGSDYMEAVAYAIKSATEEIYITDWFLSPEIYLKRPALSDEWRFDKMLEKKANEGIRIFVLLYKEVELAIGINSSYSKRKLLQAHPENVKVLRYPDHTGQNAVLFWGHHEKLVIIDQSIALFGGFDLCYGRWDNYHHLLTDFGSALPMKHHATQNVPRTHSVPLINQMIQSPVSIDALDLDGATCNRFINANDHIEQTTDRTPSPSSRPITTTTDAFFPSKIAQFRSEYHLKDHLKEPHSFGSISYNINDNSVSLSSNRSMSKTLNNDRTSDTIDRIINPTRRFSSSDIDQQSVHLLDTLQHRQLIEQQKKRRIYHFNHTLFSNIYKRTHRLSSADSHMYLSSIQNRERHTRRRHQSVRDSDMTDQHTTSDSVYSRALEKYILNHEAEEQEEENNEGQQHRRYRTLLSLSDGGTRRISAAASLRHRLSSHGNTSDLQVENKQQQLKMTKLNAESNNRGKKLSFLLPRRRASYYPDDTSNVLSDEQKKKRDVIWPLKRSYSFDTPFHRETIDALNKDSGSRWERLKLGIQSKINRFTKSTEDVSTLTLTSIPRRNSTETQPISTSHRHIGVNVGPTLDRIRLRDKIRRVKLNIKTTWKQRSDLNESDQSDIDNSDYYRDSLHDDMSSFIGSSRRSTTNQLGLQGSSKLWFGKDYANFLLRDFRNLDQPFQDQIDRNTTPRMPWHDVGALVYGACARDLARHFIERWNFVKLQKAKDNERYPFLLPKSYGSYTPCPKLLSNTFNCSTQGLRSVGPWSTGRNDTEESIHNAFIDIITKAKYYIYIENQFFVSLIDDSTVRNGIADALFKRILRAHQEKETFRVYIVMPLIPGFEGQYGTSKATALQAITHWNYRSISQGQQSLLARLAKEVGDPHRYICFFGLRTWSEMNGRLVSEIVYVHSKFAIVDDNRVLIGSANINDRSLIGDRDSEVSVLFEDTEFVRGMMNGQNVQVGKFASGLRKRLFREHLGDFDGTQINYQDPISDSFYKDTWLSTAARNTTMFEKIFNCIPTDSAFTFSQLREIQAASKLCETNPEEARRLLQSIRGYLVLIPHKFLSKEYLGPRLPAKEILAPSWFWT
ncbi:unnamed protein product [Rotaria sordida]|uniref:Phospholipase n=1 Tax=Rotaria sordida TaxID=392033 RepID=A0A818GCM1_9BILA|nr:unnamed protein product [Rotaria sordida]